MKNQLIISPESINAQIERGVQTAVSLIRWQTFPLIRRPNRVRPVELKRNPCLKHTLYRIEKTDAIVDSPLIAKLSNEIERKLFKPQIYQEELYRAVEIEKEKL